MAKDVVFESEKYMQRQEAKRKWIPILCIAAVLLLVVVIALAVRGSKGTTTIGGEDTPYPYSWRVDSKGVLHLDLQKGGAEGYSWSASDVDTAGLEISYPQKEAEGADSFILTPTKAGRHIAAFSLRNLQDRSDCLYEWRFVMDSASSSEGEESAAGPLSILSVSGLDLGGKKHSAQTDAVSYAIHEDPDGNVVVEIINPSQDSLTIESGDTILSDPDEGDVVSEEKRGEEDGGQKPQAAQPSPDATVITDPAEIEELVGIPYDEWVAMVQAEAEAEAQAQGISVYDYNWTASSDNETAVDPAGVFYTGEMAIATLNPGTEDGSAAISIHNDLLGLEVYAEVENNDGRLSIVSYGSRSYEPVFPMEEELDALTPAEGAGAAPAEETEPAQP